MFELRLFATFREGREKIMHLDEKEIPNTGEIIRLLGIPAEEVSILLINGRHDKLETPLKAGDVVALFPPVGGG